MMDYQNDGGAWLEALQEQLLPRLPLLLIVLALMGNALLASQTTLRDWLTLAAAQAEADALATEVAAMTQAELDEPFILQAQLQRLNTSITDLRGNFLNPVQPDAILNTLFVNAGAAGVTIVKLQAVEPDPTLADAPYTRQTFQLEVRGDGVIPLFNFLILLNETDLAAVEIANLDLAQDAGTFRLTFTLHLYTIPEVPATDLDALPTAVLLVVRAPATPTPLPSPPPAGGMPAATPLPGGGAPGTVASPPAPTPTPPPFECAGAPPTQIKIGDTVVVQFEGQGALRVLLDARGGAPSTLMQVYEGDRLEVLSGPLCSPWLDGNILYWYVDYQGKRGWVGEGTAENRWLCPTDLVACGASGP